MRLACSVLVWLVAAACGGDDDGGGGGGDPDGGGGNPECEVSAGETPASGVVRIGAVESLEFPRASIDGVLVAGTDWQFFDMAPQRQVESAREGDCVLYEWEPSFCEPACEIPAGICHDGECKSAPELISAGTIRLVVGGALIQANPDAPTFWGPTYREEVPAVPAGEQIALCAAGDAAGGFGAILESVEPLEGALPEDGVFELEDGGDVVASWEPPGSPARVRLTLNADNMQHGLPFRAILECDAEDTGQLVIPQALVEAFPAVARPPENFACAGTDCPPSQLVRYRAVVVDEPDLKVQVRAESAVEFWIEH